MEAPDQFLDVARDAETTEGRSTVRYPPGISSSRV